VSGLIAAPEGRENDRAGGFAAGVVGVACTLISVVGADVVSGAGTVAGAALLDG
jgi:hypothetical protein